MFCFTMSYAGVAGAWCCCVVVSDGVSCRVFESWLVSFSDRDSSWQRAVDSWGQICGSSYAPSQMPKPKDYRSCPPSSVLFQVGHLPISDPRVAASFFGPNKKKFELQPFSTLSRRWPVSQSPGGGECVMATWQGIHGPVHLLVPVAAAPRLRRWGPKRGANPKRARPTGPPPCVAC